MNATANNLLAIHKTIISAENEFHRVNSSVQLLAVSKKQPIEKIQQAIKAGQQDFGENFLQEALSKIKVLGQTEIVWHFIGAIQSNKTQPIAENFAWAHTISRKKIAKKLNDFRPNNLPALNVCIQVNISNEENKSGVSVNELPELVAYIAQLPKLRLRGLMCIPQKTEDFTEQRHAFHECYLAFEKLKQQGYQLDTLSMGMTNDMRAAIAEGATIVRVGTGVFGERE